MRRFVPLFVLSLSAALSGTAQAQSPAPRFEVGAALSQWMLDRGMVSGDATVRPGASLSLGVYPGADRSSLGLSVLAGYAPEADYEPGIISVLAELELAFGGSRAEGVRLAGVLGAGAMRFAADRQETRLKHCTFATGCMFEGITYRSGWRNVASGGMKADLVFGRSFAIQPQVRMLVPVDDRTAGQGTRSPMLRADLGVVWRR